jgi:16S rRNA (guanine527-N7)-methyltransferase
VTEALEQRPAAAALAFGPGLPRAERFATMLATDGIVRGLIGPAEVPRLWTRHLLNSVAISELIPPDAAVIDVGSGAGLPGVPLAIARPDLTITLVEPLLRRATWLEEVVGVLELDHVTVVRARAEDLSGRLSAAYVTARAVAPLPRLAGWCLPLVRPEGCLLALKGRSAREELAAAEQVLQELGAAEWTVLDLDSSDPVSSTSVVQVRVGSSGPPVGRSRVARTRSGTRRRRTHP